MPDPMTFSFFLKKYNLYYIIIFRGKCWESVVSISFLKARKISSLIFRSIHLLNGILLLCVRIFNASIASQSSQWDTSIIKGEERTCVPPAVISCVSWFVFNFLVVLRDEKPKALACRRVSLVLVAWFCTSSWWLSQATTAREDFRHPTVYYRTFWHVYVLWLG